MSMDKKLTAAVYAAVEKAYDHQCDIEDAADEILEIIEADRQRRGEPVAWRYLTPTGWHATTDAAQALRIAEHHTVEPLYAAPQPAAPAQVPSEDERAAQGLSPYNPSHLTEEEWNRLIENGRKAWGKKPTKPVEVPRPHEFNTGNEKLDTLLDDTYYLVEDGGMDNAIKWHESLKEFLASIEPVKVPSDDDSLTIAYMSGYHDGKRSMTPEGWQLVPKEPTKEMLAATSWPNCAGTDYKHMLAAAPKFGEDLWTG